MRIDAARYESGQLILSTTDPEAIRFAYRFLAGEYSLKRQKKRRSLDANAYAWVLIDKIAAAMRLPKEEVYRNTLRDIGGNSETVCVLYQSVATLKRTWEHKGLGWQVDTMPSKLPGCTNAILYYGSSAYDTRQMSILIDRLVQDAKALDIETLPPNKLTAMIERWKR